MSQPTMYFPREIRDMIYGHSFDVVDMTGNHNEDPTSAMNTFPAWNAVSRATREEVLNCVFLPLTASATAMLTRSRYARKKSEVVIYDINTLVFLIDNRGTIMNFFGTVTLDFVINEFAAFFHEDPDAYDPTSEHYEAYGGDDGYRDMFARMTSPRRLQFVFPEQEYRNGDPEDMRISFGTLEYEMEFFGRWMFMCTLPEIESVHILSDCDKSVMW